MDRLVSVNYAFRAILQRYGSRVGDLLARLPAAEVTLRPELEVIAASIHDVMNTTGQAASGILQLEDARLHASPDAANLTWNEVSITVRYDRAIGWVCLALPAGLGSKAHLFRPVVGYSTRDEAATVAADCALRLVRRAANAS